MRQEAFDHLKTAGAVAALVWVATAAAGHQAQHLAVGGMEIYYGILPVEMVQGHPTDHGGKPAGKSSAHLVVALFDSTTGRRISDAQIGARVHELGLGEQSKQLDPMRIADTVTYGQYFRMAGPGPYRVSLSIRSPGVAAPVEVKFEIPSARRNRQ